MTIRSLRFLSLILTVPIVSLFAGTPLSAQDEGDGTIGSEQVDDADDQDDDQDDQDDREDSDDSDGSGVTID